MNIMSYVFVKKKVNTFINIQNGKTTSSRK